MEGSGSDKALALSQRTQCVGGDQGQNLRAFAEKFQARPLLLIKCRVAAGRSRTLRLFRVDDAGANRDSDGFYPGSHTKFGAGLFEIAVHGAR